MVRIVATIFAVAALPVPVASASDADRPLTTEQERVVWVVVYDGTPLIEFGDVERGRFLAVPKGLSSLYQDHPRQVIEVLLKIVDGGNPKDSVLAAGYALELLRESGAAVGCLDSFYNEKGADVLYDAVNKNWEKTPRQHWAKKIRTWMAEKKLP